MPPAARVGDLTIHGGAIVSGEPTVLIGGRPAARKEDAHLCPMVDPGKPHVGGAITSSSATVLIGGKLAARVGDMCGCPSAGESGAGAPPVVGPGKPPWRWSTDPQLRTIEELDKLPRAKRPRGPHAQLELLDTNRDGDYDTMRYRAHVAHVTDEDAYDVGPFELHITTTFDGMYAERTLHWSPQGIATDEETGVARVKQEMVLGPPGDPGRNPLIRRETEAKILALEASAEARDGDDGERDGFKYWFNLEAMLASAMEGVEIPVTVFIPWLFGKDMRLKVSVEGDIGEGGGAGIGHEHDEQDNRDHYLFYWGLGGLPVDLEVDFSVGATERDPAPVVNVNWPNFIATGEPTVLIG